MGSVKVFSISTNWGHCQLLPQKSGYSFNNLGRMDSRIDLGLAESGADEIQTHNLKMVRQAPVFKCFMPCLSF